MVFFAVAARHSRVEVLVRKEFQRIGALFFGRPLVDGNAIYR